jgi:GNAT superfamily N-acetyltransferase
MTMTLHGLPDSEKIERDALVELFSAASPELSLALGLCHEAMAGGVLGLAAGLPASAIVINRVLAAGLGEAVTREQVRQLVGRYREAGVVRYFVQVHPQAQPASVRDWLLAEGLEKARGWQKFQRSASLATPVRSSLQCRRIGGAQGEAFARILCDAFDLGDEARPWFALLPDCPRWHAFMSFDGDEPAGTGALFVDSGLGWLDFGATAPAFRQCGSQSALMAARIDHAVKLGCHTLFTCTGEDVPGDPQHSYNNILRAGFTETYLRENYAPPL